MGVIYVHDQNNPAGTQLPSCSHGLHELLFVQFVPLEGPFANGTPMTDRFTDYLGKIGTEGIAATFQTGKFQLRVNEANVLTNWKTARKVTNDIETDAVDIQVERVGIVPDPPPTECPVGFDKASFTAWFNKNKVGFGPSEATMRAMHPALQKCGFEWQNDCRPSSEWRPRIHQPPFLNGPCSGSTHDVDCGDFGGPWVLTFRY